MSDDDVSDLERWETLKELIDATRLAEEMAQRLVSETHGELYHEAVALRTLMHQARTIAERMDGE